MLRVWLGGFAIGSVFGAAGVLLVLVVIWLAEPAHLAQLDKYPDSGIHEEAAPPPVQDLNQLPTH
jgi:hypothetical protein